MRIISRLLIAIVLVLIACAGHVVYVMHAPPPVRAEVAGPPPVRHAVWIAGSWHYDGVQYVWTAGRWDAHPRGRVWAPGHWRQTRRGWQWVPGHWVR